MVWLVSAKRNSAIFSDENLKISSKEQAMTRSRLSSLKRAKRKIPRLNRSNGRY